MAPRAAEIDHTGQFPWDMKALLAQQDIYAMCFPVEYGGIGASELAIIMAIEELSRHCATTGVILAVQQLGATPILLAGNEEQKSKYLPPLASGAWLAAFALTEAGSGSDAGAMQTRAVRKGDKYILNGSKRFITNGGLAQVNSVFAITDSAAGTRGISAFIVEKDFPGFSVGRVEDKMGIKGSQTAELIFTDCEVPAENLLGREGDGFKIAEADLDSPITHGRELCWLPEAGLVPRAGGHASEDTRPRGEPPHRRRRAGRSASSARRTPGRRRRPRSSSAASRGGARTAARYRAPAG